MAAAILTAGNIINPVDPFYLEGNMFFFFNKGKITPRVIKFRQIDKFRKMLLHTYILPKNYNRPISTGMKSFLYGQVSRIHSADPLLKFDPVSPSQPLKRCNIQQLSLRTVRF